MDRCIEGKKISFGERYPRLLVQQSLCFLFGCTADKACHSGTHKACSTGKKILIVSVKLQIKTGNYCHDNSKNDTAFYRIIFGVVKLEKLSCRFEFKYIAG
jgi:hypothetical protein